MSRVPGWVTIALLLTAVAAPGTCRGTDTFAGSAPDQLASLDGLWVALAPSGRYHAAAIYDPPRERMLAFGGYDGQNLDEVWMLSLAGEPLWSRISPSGTPPVARIGHSAIYDPLRDRLLVFAGNSLNDVWELSLSGAPAWVKLAPTGTPPALRAYHSAIYDPVRDRMIIFGGNPSTPRNDVWALSLAGTPAWTQLTPTGTPPAARAYHGAVYDPIRDRMLIFGGSGAAYYNDTWALSLGPTPAWSLLAPTGGPPLARRSAGVVYDAALDRMIVFAGYDGGTYRNDAWALSLAGTPAWTALAPAGGPPVARERLVAIYDPPRGRLVAFGGWTGSYCRNDTWALALSGPSAWSEISPGGAAPSMRETFTSIVDGLRQRMVIFGGWGGGQTWNDVWALSLTGPRQWTQLAPTGTPPTGRYGASAIYDAPHDRMIVFGGYDTAYRNEVWALSFAGTPTWTQLAPSGTLPAVRGYHTAIYDPLRERMIVFGGLTGSTSRNDTWQLTLGASPAWSQLAPGGTPPGVRYGHTAILDPLRDRMIVCDGGASGVINDVWELALGGGTTWTQLAPGGVPPAARRSHSAIYDSARDRMVIHGGNPAPSDTWAMSFGPSSAWTKLLPDGVPSTLWNDHQAIYDAPRDRMVVFGGRGSVAVQVRNGEWDLRFSGTVDAPARPTGAGVQLAAAPNPVHDGIVRIEFVLPAAGSASLRVFDASGRLVRTLLDGPQPAGPRAVSWDGRLDSGARTRPGIYFCELRAAGVRLARKIAFVP